MFFIFNFYGFFLYVIFVISIITIFVLYNQSKIKNNDFIIGIMIFLILVTSSLLVVIFRDFPAPDNEQYVKLYSRLLDVGILKESVSSDYGFVYLLYILSYFNFPPDLLIDFLYIVIIVVVIISIIRFSSYFSIFLVLCLVILFSWGMLDLFINTQRQGLSVAFIILAFSYRFTGNKFIFLFFILLASSFHWTGYFAISVVILSSFFKKFSNTKLYVLSFGVFIFSLFNSSLFLSITTGIIDSLSSLILPLKIISYKINWYLNTGVSIPLILKIRIAVEFLFFNIFFLILIWNTKDKKNNDLINRLKFEMALILLISSFITWSEYSFRVYNLYIPYMFIVFSRFLTYEKYRVSKLNNNILLFFVAFFILTHLTFWRSGILFYMYRGSI